MEAFSLCDYTGSDFAVVAANTPGMSGVWCVSMITLVAFKVVVAVFQSLNHCDFPPLYVYRLFWCSLLLQECPESLELCLALFIPRLHVNPVGSPIGHVIVCFLPSRTVATGPNGIDIYLD